MTSQYPGVDVIKNVEVIIYKSKSDIMSLLGHDDVIFIQVRSCHGLFLPTMIFLFFLNT